MRINYTAYDVRRSQDVVNTSNHSDIMVLHDLHSNQPFSYARVIGIYHANIVYTGPGMTNYESRRMEFLFVRWYEHQGIPVTTWDTLTLDSIQFMPVAGDNAFGFIDPCDVLRACHIVPAFSKGRTHNDNKGLSRIAKDSSDWHSYLVNRSVQSQILVIRISHNHVADLSIVTC
jgi:hypothetical protein